MSIQENLQNIKDLEEKITAHPCNLEHSFDKQGRLMVFLPYGYYYKGLQGFRLNETSKAANLTKALEMLENIWDESLSWWK